MSLYADDMLLYLSDPLTSIPNALSLLEEFGKISGYKINLQKCEIMPVNTAAMGIDFSLFPLRISPQKFKYLGIWITHIFQGMFKANFSPLLTQLKQDLEHWNLLPLSLGGRINIIKMKVLPKFLYVFQCVCLYLSKSLCPWTSWYQDLYGIRKTLQYGREFYNSTVNLEDYPSLTSSFMIGLPI